ncbi:SRPBCC family protein [Nocardia salmonicida]|uniref:SRPBCC family protein n=1 Tax=Nocardia salmonicida TaxID=53431 RepID=UPI002E2D7651|nr:SRPBCC family protein [Nocardia salmonicida]
MGEYVQRCVCAAPLPITFAFVDDAARLPEWVIGVSAFTHTGGPNRGVESLWQMQISFGPMKRRIPLRCTEWTQNQLIIMRSTSGRELRIEFRFAADTPTDTAVDIVVGYPEPEGAAERALAAKLESLATVAMGRIAVRLRDRVAEQYSRSPRGNGPAATIFDGTGRAIVTGLGPTGERDGQ